MCCHYGLRGVLLVKAPALSALDSDLATKSEGPLRCTRIVPALQGPLLSLPPQAPAWARYSLLQAHGEPLGAAWSCLARAGSPVITRLAFGPRVVWPYARSATHAGSATQTLRGSSLAARSSASTTSARSALVTSQPARPLLAWKARC
jgi:hypothetical protein